jgi:hypothetical protein
MTSLRQARNAILVSASDKSPRFLSSVFGKLVACEA